MNTADLKSYFCAAILCCFQSGSFYAEDLPQIPAATKAKGGAEVIPAVRTDAQTSKPMLRKWVQEFSSNERHRFLEFIGIAKPSKRLLAIETSLEASKPYNSAFKLWEFARDGKVVSEIPLEGRPADEVVPLVPLNFIGAFSTKNGDLVVIGKAKSNDDYSLIKLDQQHKVVLSKVFTTNLPHCRFYKAVIQEDDQILLVGTVKNSGLLVRINSDADITLTRTFDRPDQESMFTDIAIETGSKELLLAGFCYAKLSKFGTGPADVWLLRCTSNGEVLKEQTVPGRWPHIGALPNEETVMVYDKHKEIQSDCPGST
ncbi:MAG: hypothetical protein SGJ20_11410 [Planctomycetota bacterium]|nr:hypothetical protein [Planctomycetota bacterium]